MAEIAPFRALRFAEPAGALEDLITPPYDVISEAERDRLYRRSPFNFVRVEYPKPDGDPYTEAASTLAVWRAEGVLREDPAPALYVHDHEFVVDGARLRRRGFHCALRLRALDEGVVLPHELTFPNPRADRLALLRATRANTSAVFAMYPDEKGEIAGTLTRSVAVGGSAALVADVARGDERHRIWAVNDSRPIAELSKALASRRVYIADGNHRYETALTYLAERGEQDAAARYTLAYLCALEDPGLRIFAKHRIVHGDGLADAIDRSFEQAPVDAGALGDIQPGIVVAREGRFTQLHLRADADLSALRPAWRNLPVAQAEELLLRRAREAGAEVSYEHDLKAAIAAAERGTTAVLLRAIDPETLRRVADAGERLPQKTTYFYPKVPAGLVVRSLD